MSTQDNSKRMIVVACAAVSILVWLGWVFFMRFVAPAYVNTFYELKVDLPLPTLLVLNCASNIILIGVIAGAGILAGTRTIASVNRLLDKNWAIPIGVALLVVSVLALLISYGALEMPYQQIQHALQKK